ncbi:MULTISPECIES: hypothetical protein [Caulobacter]|uniref:Uncharacterized protein n=1 Tax=Caulobacter vibrioides OR37 TaxID=1292034 RepID=R0EPL7_CAUVI|nr:MULTISPECIES: hypothetical protein [Caulobacter]ENZ82997.1 hypothetical protein OR37_01192 [Caulobacter vibrioides OR37]MBQ1561195.1 hypothetical protein [Caulobacter sp.]
MSLRTPLLALTWLGFLALPAQAQGPTPPTSNAEMTRIYDEDQGDRQKTPIDWSKVTPRDEQRREATRKLLADGALHTAEDFRHAAFIYQHGAAPNDYLLAHTLAMVAVGKGDNSSLWIASATLDRYLMKIDKPQIYGTQFMAKTGEEMGQDPYDRDLVSDALRAELGVPTQAQQAEQLKMIRARHPAAPKPETPKP